MENFVFPNEIKTKLMKMVKLINIVSCPVKFCEIPVKIGKMFINSYILSLSSFHWERRSFPWPLVHKFEIGHFFMRKDLILEAYNKVCDDE